MSQNPNIAVNADPKPGTFALLSGLLGAGHRGEAAEAGSAPGMPRIQGRELLASLMKVQRGEASAFGTDAEARLAPILREAGNMQNVLRRLKATRVGAGLAGNDAVTLDIVAMLVDALFEDPKMPAALKGLIGRLQLTMLKLAFDDKRVFDDRAHPARRLFDTLGQLGLRLPRELNAASPIFPLIAERIDEVVRSYRDDIAVFTAARQSLEALVAAEDERIASQLAATQVLLEQAEQLAPAAEDHAAARLPEALVEGAWVTFADTDSRYARPARLHYVSPRRHYFLFVDRRGDKVLECPLATLNARLELGQVVLLDDEPDASLFDRMVEAVVAKLCKPVAVPLRRRSDRMVKPPG